MLRRADLPRDFRKDVYDDAMKKIGDLPMFLANEESTADATPKPDPKGHFCWVDGAGQEALVVVAGQIDETAKFGCLGNKVRDTAMVRTSPTSLRTLVHHANSRLSIVDL